MATKHKLYTFRYLGYDEIVGGEPNRPDTIDLVVEHADISGLINKIIRAVRDDVSASHTTISLRGVLGHGRNIAT